MRVHTAWLETQLNTIPAATVNGRSQVFVSKAVYPDDPSAVVSYPYWVIHPQDGTDTATRFASPAFTQSPRFTIHSVGGDANQAAAAGEAVKKLLMVNGLGVVPSITGEHSRPVWYDVPTPIQVNDSVSPAVCWHVAECGFDSDLIFT